MLNLFEYKGDLYPEYLKQGNANRFITYVARLYCTGQGLDVGAGMWPLPGATAVDLTTGTDALNVPAREDGWDYIFSSHCLEHVINPVAVLEHWKDRLRTGGVLFLYLPHPEMSYWRPQNCRKHLHMWFPEEMAEIVHDLGFKGVLYSQRDMMWSFTVVCYKDVAPVLEN